MMNKHYTRKNTTWQVRQASYSRPNCISIISIHSDKQPHWHCRSVRYKKYIYYICHFCSFSSHNNHLFTNWQRTLQRVDRVWRHLLHDIDWCFFNILISHHTLPNQRPCFMEMTAAQDRDQGYHIHLHDFEVWTMYAAFHRNSKKLFKPPRPDRCHSCSQSSW